MFDKALKICYTMNNFSMMLSGLKKTDSGEIPENLFFKSAEGARGNPNLSGKRTERKIFYCVYTYSLELLS